MFRPETKALMYFFCWLAMPLSSAQATIFGWDAGGGADNSWTQSANWSPSGVPSAADIVLLTGTSTAGPQTIDVGGLVDVTRIEANAVPGTYTFGETIGADTIRFSLAGGNTILNRTVASQLVFNSNVLLAPTEVEQRFNTDPAGGQIIVHGDVTSAATSGTTHLMLTSRNTNVPGIVQVHGDISDGTGTNMLKLTAGYGPDSDDHRAEVVLTGMNSYSGPTDVNGATLTFNSIANIGGGPSALGAPTTVANGTIDLGHGGGSVAPGTLRYVGSGHSSNRAIHLPAGPGGILVADGTGPMTLSGGVTASSSSSDRRLTLSGESLSANTISGVIASLEGSGVLDVVKSGTGCWVLTGDNEYDGDTRISEGTLVTDGVQAIPIQSAVDISAGATLDVTTNIVVETFGALTGEGTLLTRNHVGANFDSSSSTFAGRISGPGNFQKRGTGVLTLTQASDFTGEVAVYEGILKVDGGTISSAHSGLLLPLAAGFSPELFITGGGSVTLASNLSIEDANATLKIDNGSLTATRIDRQAGTIDWISGSIQLNSDVAIGDGGGINRPFGEDLYLNSGHQLTVNSLTIEPTGEFSLQANALTTDLLVNDGVLFSTLPTVIDSTVIHNGSAAVTSDLTFTGSVTGEGDFVGSGHIKFEGDYAPGNNVGSVFFIGDVTVASTGLLEIELSGSGTQEYDRLGVNSRAYVLGGLEVTTVDGFQPQAGDEFRIIHATGGVYNQFSTVDLPDLASGLNWNVDYQFNQVVLEVLADPVGDFNGDGALDGIDIDALVGEIVAMTNIADYDLTGDGFVDNADLQQWLVVAGTTNLPSGNPYLVGDANLDGIVDGLDFILWNSHKFTSTAAWTAGDFTADGVIDGLDFIEWNANKFTSADATAAVPEPHSLSWIILGLALLRRSRMG